MSAAQSGSLTASGLPTTKRAAAAHRAYRHSIRKTLLMLLVGFIVGIEFLENGMFVFAASHIMGGIDAAPREFAQVLAAYAIGNMMMIGMQQWLSRYFGYRYYLCLSLMLFLVGALASAAATGLYSMMFARVIQGFGGGALFTSCRILVPVLFTRTDRPRALKYFMLMLFGLSSFAPVLSACLVDGWGWRWIFLSVTPFVLLALIGIWVLMPPTVGRDTEPVRWAAGPLLLFAAAITLVQLSLSEARYDVFGHPVHLLIMMALGAVLLAWFLWHQWHHHEPLLRLRELAHPAYLLGLGLYFLHYCLSNTSSYLFPIMAETGLGIPITYAGWLNTYAAGVSLVVAYGYLKLSSRTPKKKPFMVIGAASMALAAWSFSLVPADVPATALLLALAAKGVFGVLLVLPVANMTFRELGDERFAHAYQSKNLMRQLASSFSTAVAAIVLQNREFVNRTELIGSLTSTNAQASNWLDSVQAGFSAHSLAPSQATGAALAELERMVSQQTLLLACQDLYRFLAVLALATMVLVLVQRRFK